MIADTYTCSPLGIDVLLVEVDLAPGLSYFAAIIRHLTSRSIPSWTMTSSSSWGGPCDRWS